MFGKNRCTKFIEVRIKRMFINLSFSCFSSLLSIFCSHKVQRVASCYQSFPSILTGFYIVILLQLMTSIHYFLYVQGKIDTNMKRFEKKILWIHSVSRAIVNFTRQHMNDTHDNFSAFCALCLVCFNWNEKSVSFSFELSI